MKQFDGFFIAKAEFKFMGSIVWTIANYFDMVTETVGIKSGLLLTNAETVSLLKEQFNEPFFDNDKMNDGIRIRAEEVESHIKWVRYRIGNLSEDELKPVMASDRLMKWEKKGFDTMAVADILLDVMTIHKGEDVDPSVIIMEVRQLIDVPEMLIIDLALLFAQHQFTSSYLPPHTKWDGGTPLRDLFNCEVKGGEQFLDQKFIDYLAANSENLEYIHWRNFERMCAEYFNRMGYEIVLGPGSNDGGVDIRAFSKTDIVKPLLLIQCKRYKKENKIDIPTVKAFYADVEFEQAKHGLIATTSFISDGGKKIVSARNYPLSFAENEDVKNWASAMWRYGKSERNS